MGSPLMPLPNPSQFRKIERIIFFVYAPPNGLTALLWLPMILSMHGKKSSLQSSKRHLPSFFIQLKMHDW